MYNIENFTSIAELDSAKTMVESLRTDVKRRQRSAARQISNAETNYVSLATKIRILRNQVKGQQFMVNQTPNDLSLQLELENTQRDLQTQQNKDANYGKSAQQSKVELMAMLDGRLAIIEAVLVALETRRTQLAA